MGPGTVAVKSIDFPKLVHPLDNSEAHEGVIVKVLASCICGSDQHMVRSRTTAPSGLILGHEITGEVVEVGKAVRFLKQGDFISVPFNVACGKCRNCREGLTGICLTVNPARPGGAYGYVDMGGWIGGQAEYVMIPYADFNALKLPNDRGLVMEKIRDFALLSDIFPTGFHGAVKAGVGVGSIVLVAGAGPVGLSCAVSCQLLGAAVVIVTDLNKDRLAQAKKIGCEVIDVSKTDDIREAVRKIIGGNGEVDAAIDCVGFEARGCGHHHHQEVPAQVINTAMDITRAGGNISLPGLYVTEDPGAVDVAAKQGSLSVRLGLGWAKSISIHTGQTPVLRYNQQLMRAIIYDKVKIADAVNAKVISLDEAPMAYAQFDQGLAAKFIIDPHNQIKKFA